MELVSFGFLCWAVFCFVFLEFPGTFFLFLFFEDSAGVCFSLPVTFLEITFATGADWCPCVRCRCLFYFVCSVGDGVRAVFRGFFSF